MRQRSPIDLPTFSRSRFLGLVFAGVCACLSAAAAHGEDVVLTNGRVFRGVTARVENGTVRIEMPGGTVGFPVSSVLRIDASSSAYRVYRERHAALASATPPATAAQWLELAEWAKAQGLDGAAREAALIAARLDPQVAGLPALLGELGYVFDRDQGAYLSIDEAMARAGKVFYDGAWVTSAERTARENAAAERSAAASRRAAAEEPQPTETTADRGYDPDDDGLYVQGIPLSSVGGYGGVPYVPGYAGRGGFGRGFTPGTMRPPGHGPLCPSCGAPAAPAPRPERVAPAASSAARTWAVPRPRQ